MYAWMQCQTNIKILLAIMITQIGSKESSKKCRELKRKRTDCEYRAFIMVGLFSNIFTYIISNIIPSKGLGQPVQRILREYRPDYYGLKGSSMGLRAAGTESSEAQMEGYLE